MFLYDPRSNVMKELTLKQIGDIANLSESAISRCMSEKRKVKSINCYVFKENPSAKERKTLYEEEVFQGEVWHPLFTSAYEVSNYGRIRKRYKKKTSLIMPFFRRKHLQIKLNFEGSIKEYKVRDIVAAVYLKAKSGKDCIVYRNGDRTDCSVWNLKRANRSEVAKKAGATAKSKPVVLIDEKTKEIIDEWKSAREAAKHLFMSHESVRTRCTGLVKSRKEGWLMWEEEYERMMVQ